MTRIILVIVFVAQLTGVAAFAAFLFALVFHPEAIGAVPAKIIVGFQHAYESGSQ